MRLVVRLGADQYLGSSTITALYLAELRQGARRDIPQVSASMVCPWQQMAVVKKVLSYWDLRTDQARLPLTGRRQWRRRRVGVLFIQPVPCLLQLRPVNMPGQAALELSVLKVVNAIVVRNPPPERPAVDFEKQDSQRKVKSTTGEESLASGGVLRRGWCSAVIGRSSAANGYSTRPLTHWLSAQLGRELRGRRGLRIYLAHEIRAAQVRLANTLGHPQGHVAGA